MNLYIDFDGVISDTIDVTYAMLIDAGIDSKDFKKTNEFYKKLDWTYVLENTPLINNSMDEIKKIIASNRFDVAILTHVSSQTEAVAKIRFIRKYLNEITIIAVPKEVSKTQMVCARDAILIDDFTKNLDEWSSNGGIGIKFSKVNRKTKYINITNLGDVLALDVDKC